MTLRKNPSRLVLAVALGLAGLASGQARAGLVLTTSSPPGTPLVVDAGMSSGPMSLSTYSDNSPADVMSAWNVQLIIVADPGTTGQLTFLTPGTGTPANPPDYVFGGDGLGIVVINTGETLSANDFFDPAVGPGAAVPASPGANLLQLTFSASADAAGLFGIYAVRGSATTQWTDADFTTRFFENVPDGTGVVRIGDVLVAGTAVPEPSSLAMACAGLVAVAGLAARRRRRRR
ncbi:PEP-CTERM motif protein [Aquisphaera giovannonii]|uniref:PEP-CTERM motif protein n=1 Tax=Aquisphaera giovannonii TaxID=406548 RepID=A0A5B9VV05_9BACT|nr:PEP-CTERM sorting domain-containing protein [Aquisphaera giovannonii]QEH31555.1 PEP-CTERM motif protein [Aquisphaera giovannonii]